MKINTILNRYLLREMFPPFLTSLLFLSFVFLMTQIVEVTNLIVNHNLSVGFVVLLLFYGMPFFWGFVVPMAVMMAVLSCFLRLSGDNEITALKAGGVGVYRMLPPVLLFCMLGVGLTAFMVLYGLPWGRVAAKTVLHDAALQHFEVGIKERTFNDSFDNIVIYLHEFDHRNRTLRDVFIQDQRSPDSINTIIAPRGIILSDPARGLFRLRLFEGRINRVDVSAQAVNWVSFDTYDITLNVNHALKKAAPGQIHQEEMLLHELREQIAQAPEKDARYYKLLLEYHKKFALPFACLSLGLLAMPLGIQSRSSRRSVGLGLGLIFFLIYYVMLAAGWVFGEAGIYPPAIGMWAPNVVFGGLGIIMLAASMRDRTLRA